jgi:hypothetical protein
MNRDKHDTQSERWKNHVAIAGTPQDKHRCLGCQQVRVVEKAMFPVVQYKACEVCGAIGIEGGTPAVETDK